ncbi:MAG: hypothetical protein JW395_3336 [Nitrospira sp.]|nr:hypothetical protein [Nitrospira sp.]
MENERFLTWILPDLGIRIVSKDRVQHVRDMQQFMAAIAHERRIVKATRDKFDPNASQSFFFELSSQLMFDGSPLPEDIDAFLIFLQHPLDEHDSHPLIQRRIFVEGITDDIGKPPDSEHILVELLELTLPIVERKLLIDRVGEFVELFIIGGVAFPFRLFDERVNDLLQQGRLKTKFHTSPRSSNPIRLRRQTKLKGANQLP